MTWCPKQVGTPYQTVVLCYAESQPMLAGEPFAKRSHKTASLTRPMCTKNMLASLLRFWDLLDSSIYGQDSPCYCLPCRPSNVMDRSPLFSHKSATTYKVAAMSLSDSCGIQARQITEGACTRTVAVCTDAHAGVECLLLFWCQLCHQQHCHFDA